LSDEISVDEFYEFVMNELSTMYAIGTFGMPEYPIFTEEFIKDVREIILQRKEHGI